MMSRTKEELKGATDFSRALHLPKKSRQLINATEAYEASRNARAKASQKLSDLRLIRNHMQSGISVNKVVTAEQLDDAAAELAELVDQEVASNAAYGSLQREHAQHVNDSLHDTFDEYGLVVLAKLEELIALLTTGEEFHRSANTAGVAIEHPAIKGSKQKRGLLDMPLKMARSGR